jgi:predicted dehydrogenase
VVTAFDGLRPCLQPEEPAHDRHVAGDSELQTPMTPLRVVVAGAGLMGRWHIHAARAAGATIAGVVDREPARARAHAPHGADVATELGPALRLKPDVVHICTPPDSHLELCHTALEAGCHVIVEKPVTPTTAGAAALQARATELGRLLVPVHQFVWQRGIQQILAARRRLGTIRHIEFATCSAGADRPDAPDRDAIALEIAPHAFSLARALLDAPVGRLDWRLDRAAPGEWRFTATTPEGCTLSNLISLQARPTFAIWRVLAQHGSARADLFHGFATFEPGTASRGYKTLRPIVTGVRTASVGALNLGRRAIRWEPAYPGLRELCQRTYGAIRGGPHPFDAAELIDVAQAIDYLRDRLTKQA